MFVKFVVWTNLRSIYDKEEVRKYLDISLINLLAKQNVLPYSNYFHASALI